MNYIKSINPYKAILTFIVVALIVNFGLSIKNNYQALWEKANKVDSLQSQLNYVGNSYCKFVAYGSQGQVQCKVENGSVTLP